MAHTHAGYIDQLGGSSNLARRLGVPIGTVRQWRVRGIPAPYWHRVEMLSGELSVTARELAATKHPAMPPVPVW